MNQGGDDLDDDYVPDDLIASEEEEEDAHELLATPFQNVDGVDDEGLSDTEAKPTVNPNRQEEKKRKRREKEKERKRRKVTAAEVATETNSVADGDPNSQAEYIADTQAWIGPRSPDQLVEFIMKVLPPLHTRLGQKSKSNGAPTLLFVAGAALRVADITRILKDKRLRGDKGGDVAKLFAKHFKLSEHISYLKRTKIGTAVGTPARLGQLLESDALSESALTHIILDITFHDAKKRSLLDIPETRDEVFKHVLGAPKVLKAIKDGKVQVVLY
ncbi:hypothetical protein ONZ45_g5274 [Pleurotus djamor]|nr:hypothetical protein ONZ45_g5274 [Pleurotus djamor]